MTITEDLSVFGLTDDEQKVYLLLVKKGWSTVVQLSKNCPIKRSTIYRVLESLIEKGLVVTQLGEKTSFYNVSSADSFKTIILESEAKTREMKASVEKIRQFSEQIVAGNPGQTSVLYYKGVRGLKQMEWIIRGRKPDTEVLVFDSLQWNDKLGSAFTEELRQINVEKNVRIRSISNSEDPIAPDGTTTWTTNKKYTTKFYRHRLIPKKVLDIKQDIFITDDSIVFWGVKIGDEVAIQVTNSEYASMLRQLFEFVWDKAKAIDNFGQRFR